MCGIAALFAYNAACVDSVELETIRDAMAPRGPDGAGAWYTPDGRVGLGHRRLSIIDLSESGAQPMSNADGTLVVTFNGEIYNYRVLRTRLEEQGYRFRTSSDTEVLVHLYAEKGEAMVEDLRGMYAFAIWDARRQGLFLARDPYGIKPLYYADDGHTFRAASQVKALLAGGCIDTQPEPAGHVGFFLWGHVPEPYTFYRSIRALPAGCVMWVDRDGPHPPRRIAHLTQALADAERQTEASRPTDVVDLLDEALRDSVRHHLVADVEVGVFLSSGLDSTTLAALTAEEGSRLRTITLGFAPYRGTPRDETFLAEQVAARYGAQHDTIWIDRRDFEQALDPVLDAMDQPTIDGVNSYFVSMAAAQAGLKVALSGLGGDELFGGYPSFREIPRLVNVLGLIPLLTTLGRGVRTVTAPVLKQFTSPKYAGVLEYGTDFSGAYLLRRGLFMPWELPKVLDGDLVREGWAELQTHVRLDLTTDGIATDRLKVTALESSWYMRHQLLRDADWAGMAHSLEVRVPLVDWTLLRTVAPLLAVDPSLDKQDMAGTPNTPLPEAILHREKTGFAIPVRDWMLSRQEVSEQDRGLRGWARFVYQAQGSHAKEKR